MLHQHPRVLAYCRSRLPSEQDAQDACQETYVHVLEKLDTLLDHENPHGWLFVTARNSCHATLRRRDRDQRAPGRGPGIPPGQPPRAKTYQDHEDLRRAAAQDDAQDRAEARRRIELLPDGLRQVALLEFEGRSRQEIAALLGVTRNAVDLKMHRIKRWFEKEAS